MAISRIGGWLRIALLSALAAVAVVTIGVAATAGYYLSSPEARKGLAARLVERYTGRALAIDGAFSVEVSLTPRLTAQRVRFANPAGSAEPEMARADYLSVAIDLPALLARRVHILDLDARDAVLRLEDPVDKPANWRFENGPDDGDPDTAASPPARWRLLVQSLELRDVLVSLRLGVLDPVDIRIESLDENSDAREMLVLGGKGSVNDTPFQVDGSIGPLQQLIRAGDVALDLGLRARDADLSVHGRVADLRTLTGADLAISLRGADASLYGEMFGMRGAFTGDVAFTAKVVPEPGRQRIVASGHIGAFETDADVTTDDLVSPRSIAGRVSVAGPDAAVVGRLAGFAQFPSGAFQGRALGTWQGHALELEEVRFESAAARLSLTARFPNFPATDSGVAELTLRGPSLAAFESTLGLGPLVEAPFELTAALEAEGRQVGATLDLGGHRLSARGRLGDYPDFDGTRVDVDIAGDDFAALVRRFDPPGALEGAYSAKAELTIDGSSLRATGVDVRNGPFELEGAVTLAEWRRPQTFSATGSLDIANLASAGAAFGVDGLPVAAARIEADVVATDARYRLLQGALRTGGVVLTASGALGDLGSLEGVALELDLDSPTWDALLREPLPQGRGVRPVSISAAVRGRAGGMLEIEGFELASDDNRLRTNGTLAIVDGLVGSRLDVQGSGRALAALLPPLGRYEPPDRPFEVRGSVSRPDAESIAFHALELAVGSARIELDGTARLAAHGGTRLHVSMRGDSLADLGKIGGRSFPGEPFDVVARLVGAQHRIDVEALTARWADSDLSASGSIDVSAKPRLTLRATSRHLDLRDILPQPGGDPEPGPAPGPPGRWIPEIAIPFDVLSAADADVVLHAAAFRGHLLELDGVTLDARLDDGALELRQLAYEDAAGAFRATGALRPVDGIARLELTLLADDADLGLLLAPGQPPETVPRYSIDAKLTGAGANTREIAGSLDGHVLIASDGGKISANAVDMWAGDFLTNVLNLLNPFTAANEPYVPLDCLVLNAKLVDGVIELKPGFVMRTDKVNMFVLGNASLATEQLDLSLATQARRGIGISPSSITNPYFKIGGSFAAPQLKLDPTSAALAYGFATVTGGLSILAKGAWDRLRGEVNPCPTFLPKEDD